LTFIADLEEALTIRNALSSTADISSDAIIDHEDGSTEFHSSNLLSCSKLLLVFTTDYNTKHSVNINIVNRPLAAPPSLFRMARTRAEDGPGGPQAGQDLKFNYKQRAGPT